MIMIIGSSIGRQYNRSSDDSKVSGVSASECLDIENSEVSAGLQ